MKIIDNPALGIGLLLCIGVAVFGLALMTTADGQFYARTANMVTSDDDATAVFSSLTSSDDDSPFLPNVNSGIGARVPEDSVRDQPTELMHAGSSLQLPAGSWIQSRQQPSTVRNQAVRTETSWPSAEAQPADPFAASPREQQRGQQVGTERRAVAEPFATMTRQQAEKAEKRDELLFRIVELRLQRGEYEQIAPVVMQMQNPERAIEAMLDFAEESADDENIEQLLDVATAVTVQMGQPKPPVPGMMGMPGMMPFGMGMPPGQPMPGQPMMGWSSGGMPVGMPGQPQPPPMGGGIMPPSQPVMDRLNGSIM